MKRTLLYMVCGMLVFLGTANAQSCPTPYIGGNGIQVDIPADNLPISNMTVVINGNWTYILPEGDESPHVGGGPQSSYTQTGTNAVGQIYVTDVTLNPINGKFKKKLVLIANRVTSASGADHVTIGRFKGSSTSANFLLGFDIQYNQFGNVSGITTTNCSHTSNPVSFSQQFLNVGILRPSLGLVYYGNLPAAQFHNSLFD